MHCKNKKEITDPRRFKYFLYVDNNILAIKVVFGFDRLMGSKNNVLFISILFPESNYLVNCFHCHHENRIIYFLYSSI
jgi:hypothetical protein